MKKKALSFHEFVEGLRDYIDVVFVKKGNIFAKVDDDIMLIFNDKKKHFSFKRGSESTDHESYESYSEDLLLNIVDRLFEHYKTSFPIFE